MATRFCIFAIVFLLGSEISLELSPELIVWNVGQGQWLTVIDDRACWHLDMGGEFAPWHKIVGVCRRRPNFISLSHWDADHINFVSKARSRLPNLCLLNRPDGRGSARKERALSEVPPCAFTAPFTQWSDASALTSNGRSRVVNWRGVLAPGDSTRAEEKKWVPALRGLDSVRLLVLGHHGSRTSTSELLLSSLPGLRMAIASQRRRRYGHPHAEVMRALERHHVPLLLTEDWGTIHMRL